MIKQKLTHAQKAIEKRIKEKSYTVESFQDYTEHTDYEAYTDYSEYGSPYHDCEYN
ncbi:MAG: hypothetical protein IJT35_05305 [Paludibacteraceae bacterium]|nr:hypothetical protein [Paludibacteraceae bacterium]